MTPLQQAAQAVIERFESVRYASVITPQVIESQMLDLSKALEAEQAQATHITPLVFGGIAARERMLRESVKNRAIEQAQAVEPAKLDKKDRCIDAFGNSMVSVGDHVESDDAIFFVGGISDGGLCSIDKTKPFSAKSGPMSKCVTQGNYAAKAAALSFVYPAPPAKAQL